PGERSAGGASGRPNQPPADVEGYNDLDLRISRLFRVLRDHGEDFLAKVRLTPYSQVEFEAAAAYPPGAGDVEKAVCDFVRWRQSFGGKGASWSCTTSRARGGMAGGVDGGWAAIALLPEVIDRLRRGEVLCGPALEAIAKFDHADALIYCDPPYVHGTREQNSRDVYHGEMSDEDHVRLAGVLHRCQSKVVVSGYPSDLYAGLYAGWRTVG